MVQTLVPVLSFHVNQEYIKSHLCRSLTQPEFKDCDGFCYLKKQIHNHDDNEMDHSSSTSSYVPKIPFSYLVEIQTRKSNSPDLIDEEYCQLHEPLPEQLYLDVLSPPPKG